MRILLVEDELEMAAALRSALAQHDMIVDHVTNLADGAEAIATAVHSAILLDRSLPDGDGRLNGQRLRAQDELTLVCDGGLVATHRCGTSLCGSCRYNRRQVGWTLGWKSDGHRSSGCD
jgi:CheY-like chemotaxis protein